MPDPVLSRKDHTHLQNVSLIEANLVLKNMESGCKSLLKEYMTITENYNHSAYGIKSSFLKTLLISKYGDSTGFHVQLYFKRVDLF